MDLYIYNPAIELQGVVDGYRSLRWRRKYFEPGEFELHCPATPENIKLLAPDNIVHRTDRSEAGIIEGTVIESTENGDEMTVTGRMGSSMLDRHVITPAVTFNGKTEEAMRKIVSDNCIATRPIHHLSLGTFGGFTPMCAFQLLGKSVLTVCEKLSRAAALGFRVRLDVPGKQWIFEVYSGADRSVAQTTLPYVAFSDEYSNITGAKYSADTTGSANYAYVAGEKETGSGDSKVKTPVCITIDQTNGAPQREIWVKADQQTSDESDDAYAARLRQDGIDKLAGAAKSQVFEASAINTENFAYLTDWDLGDIVTFEKWGIRLDQRVTEVEEVYENGVKTITPVCGNPLPEKLDFGSDD